MTKIQRFLLVLSASSLMLVFVCALHRILDPERVCIAWSGIREVTFNQETIPSCHAVSRLERPKASASLSEWVGRLNRLSQLSTLNDASDPISIHIDSNAIDTFTVEEQLVNIGFGLAAKSGQLERAALLGWVKNNWKDHPEFTQEVMADVLAWLAVGEESLSDPTNEQLINPHQRLKFSLLPKSLKNYCQFPYRSLLDLESCKDLQAEDAESSAPAEQVLRPLVSWSIWNFVRSLSAIEQIRFFSSLARAHFVDSPLEHDLSQEPQQWAKDKVRMLLSRWSLEHFDTDPKLTKAFHLAELNESIAYDLMVQVNDVHLQDRTLASIQKWSKFYPKKRVLFVGREKKVALPENVSVDVVPQEIETRKYVMVACNWPKPKDTVAPKNHGFFAFQVCGDGALPSWTSLF